MYSISQMWESLLQTQARPASSKICCLLLSSRVYTFVALCCGFGFLEAQPKKFSRTKAHNPRSPHPEEEEEE